MEDEGGSAMDINAKLNMTLDHDSKSDRNPFTRLLAAQPAYELARVLNELNPDWHHTVHNGKIYSGEKV